MFCRLTFVLLESNFNNMKHKGAFLVIIMLFSLTRFSMGIGENTEHKASVVIPDVALLSLQFDGNSNIELLGAMPSVAGSKIDMRENANASIWLNYSSVCRENQKRKVTATVVGELPEGVVVKLNAAGSVGAGKGALGKANGTVILSGNPSYIISGIGSCYTGCGVHNGHLLSYQLEIDEDKFYQTSEKKPVSVHVVYTLTDDN